VISRKDHVRPASETNVAERSFIFALGLFCFAMGMALPWLGLALTVIHSFHPEIVIFRRLGTLFIAISIPLLLLSSYLMDFSEGGKRSTKKYDRRHT
jgi:hypothetical protein